MEWLTPIAFNGFLSQKSQIITNFRRIITSHKFIHIIQNYFPIVNVLDFGNLKFVSDFGIRISDLKNFN